MKKLIVTTAFIALSAGAVAAQTSQARTLGDSGNPAYPLAVLGNNGATYHCRAEVIRDGKQAARECVRVGAAGAGNLFASGNGLAIGGAVAAAAVGIALIASDSNGSSSSTTTTTTN